MSSGGGGLEWRDVAAGELLLRYLPTLGLSGPALVMGDNRSDVAEGLEKEGVEVVRWNRRAMGGTPGSSMPPNGPFNTAVLRLPRSKSEFAMAIHVAASVMNPGGALLIYGAKDEGIGSVSELMEGLFSEVESVGVGGRCRVIRGVRPPVVEDLKASVDEWREVGRLDYPGLGDEWASYPGVFAHGRLDGGTRLLLDALPKFPPKTRVLDYGCGSGVVGAVARLQSPGICLHLLDVDALALEAAGENVPGAELILKDGLPSAGGAPFDAIVTNPPFHRGKAEDPKMIQELIRGAPTLLARRGRLILVAQRRLPLEADLDETFRRYSILAEDSLFRVWEGGDPI